MSVNAERVRAAFEEEKSHHSRQPARLRLDDFHMNNAIKMRIFSFVCDARGGHSLLASDHYEKCVYSASPSMRKDNQNWPMFEHWDWEVHTCGCCCCCYGNLEPPKQIQKLETRKFLSLTLLRSTLSKQFITIFLGRDWFISLAVDR